MSKFDATDALAINTIRTLSIDAIQKANSGHPGLPMGAAPMAYVLWQRHLKHNPKNPGWTDRDRFVLSAGHGSMLLYSMLHLSGYDLSLDEIKNFRQWGSKTPGHPESFVTPGVECTTGPLGQGCVNAVGMAIAERYLASLFNTESHTIVDHFTYALVGDGDLMEGISAEAASLAGHLKLGKLIYLYDSNDISLDGPTDLAFTESVMKRYESCGWQVIRVENGDTDLDAIDAAIADAKADVNRPTLIEIKTTIGYGSPNKAGKSAAHGSPLGDDEIAASKAALGWTETEAFAVPGDAAARFALQAENGQARNSEWQATFDAWTAANPELANTWTHSQNGTLPEGWDSNLPHFETGGSIATRSASGKILNGLAQNLPWFLGGDADLSCSTKTAISDGGAFNAIDNPGGRNIHYGVREHAMGAIANGMAYHGGVHNYTATFFCFLDYMKPAVRLAALNHLPVTFVFTHDSIGLGEDGPTHQPIEHLASLRSLPNTVTLRPCDANETEEAWKVALERRDGPTVLVLSRQNLPTLDAKTAGTAGTTKGAYVISEAQNGSPEVILLSTGAEVHLAIAAQKELEATGTPTRVVSMPSWELFDAQDAAYQESVLPSSIARRVAIEAGSSLGWHRWVGAQGKVIAVDKFGASAPASVIFKEYGFSVDNVVAKVNETA